MTFALSPLWVDISFVVLALALFTHASMVIAFALHKDISLFIAAMAGYSASFLSIVKVIGEFETAAGVLALLSGIYLLAVIKSRLNDRTI